MVTLVEINVERACVLCIDGLELRKGQGPYVLLESQFDRISRFVTEVNRTEIDHDTDHDRAAGLPGDAPDD